MKTYYVYILCCSDNSYYTGITNSIEHRLRQHTEGIDQDCYTYSRRPLTLVYNAGFCDVRDAIAWEKRLKGWSRKKKEVLIRGDYEGLPGLSISQYRKRINKIRNHTHTNCRVMLSSSKHEHDRRVVHPSTSSG